MRNTGKKREHREKMRLEAPGPGEILRARAGGRGRRLPVRSSSWNTTST